ncbi:MAG TPA: 8-amino-7-oxononanoate synthase, partial [Firmicutes bacterium]|nr:8-amino-7-oxononanoate synthase [Bacillota bacterium]
MSDPLGFINAELDALKEKGLYRNLRVLQGEQGAEVNYDGKKVLQLSSNNYLGLNTHPRLRKAMIDAIEKYGAGSGAVRTIAGTMSLHEELEQKLAEFKHVGGTLVLQSGFTANMGVIPQV